MLRIFFVLISIFWMCSMPAYALELELDPSLLETKTFQKIWSKLANASQDAKDLLGSEDRESRSFSEIVTFRDSKYNRLLREAREILCNSEANAQFEKIERLQLKNRKLNQEITSLKTERIGAPSESRNPLTRTKKDIDRRLAEIPQDIQDNNEAILALQAEIIAILKKSGIELEPMQLNYFLVAAEGDDLLDLMNIANNMQKIQLVIEKELLEDKNNIELARVYTGMYLMSLDSYFQAHEVAVNNIIEYRKRLLSIGNEAINNVREAEAFLQSAKDAGDKANLKSNIALGKQTLSVVKKYDSLLERRAASLLKAAEKVGEKVAYARNTYKTITNGSSLLRLINTAENDYRLLTNFKMPELKQIYDAGLMNELAKISEKIKLDQ